MFRLGKSLVIVFAFTSAFVHADKLAVEWQTRYDGLSGTLRAKNFAKFESFIADSYTWVQPGGQTKNRKESLAEFKPMFEMKRITGGEKVVAVVKKGEQVDVTYDARWVLTGKDNKISHFHEVGVDSWKRFGGKWKVIRSVDKVSEMK